MILKFCNVSAVVCKLGIVFEQIFFVKFHSEPNAGEHFKVDLTQSGDGFDFKGFEEKLTDLV